MPEYLDQLLVWIKNKRLLHDAGISIPHFQVVRQIDSNKIDLLQIQLSSVFLFIKPANLGSSGISKVKLSMKLSQPSIKPFYMIKNINRRMYTGREIECSVLGTNIGSVPSREIKPNHEFYSYGSKISG